MPDLNFTAHNVLLDNGEKTMGDRRILLSNSAMWKSVEKSIQLFMPLLGQNNRTLRVVDLGCLEGGYAVQFARAGFDTLGIEAREENLQRCNYVQSHLQLNNLKFVKDDVRNVGNYGPFDIAFCYGLLYHLDNPVQFLKSLSSCTTKLLFLNTHFAATRDLRYSFDVLNRYVLAPLERRIRLLDVKKNFKLSRLTTNEGYQGRWFPEWTEGEQRATVEKLLWSSYNNSRSFWLCKKDLTKALHSAGFTSVFEQFDFTGDLAKDDYTDYHSRTMFVAVKHE
jgi:hypothetical protein